MIQKFKNKFFSKISNKIFLTSLFLILIILLIQGFVFRFVIDDAYFLAQENELKIEFEAFVSDLEDKNYDLEYANLITRDYIIDTNNPIAIIEEDELVYNDAFFSTYFDSVTLMKDNQVYKFILENPEINILDHSNLNIAAVPIGKDWYYPIIISDQTITEEAMLETQEEDLVLIEDGEIISYSFAKVESSYSGIFVLLGYEYIENGQYNPSKGEAQSFMNIQKDINTETLVYIDSYRQNDKNYYILTTQTFTSFDQQMAFINSFNVFIFLIGLIIAVFLTRFYSRSISKPLIELKEVASEMADLNFSRKANIKGHDEIGSLGSNLNELSSKLEKSIDSLKIKNEELTHNYELKSKEEKRAKDLILHLSHELNTPLGIVSGFNEVLSDGINDKEPAYYHEAMAHELDRMRVLINDMLDLSVLESGNYQLEVGSIHPDKMVYEILGHYKEKFDDKSIRVEVTLSDDIVVGNMKKIYQVVDNFISNASKYTDPQGVFRISSKISNDLVVYRFENTCKAIVNEDLSKLWEKFYRTNKTNTRQEKGSGIGLSISKEILDLHQSHYDIIATENGLALTFTLKKM